MVLNGVGLQSGQTNLLNCAIVTWYFCVLIIIPFGAIVTVRSWSSSIRLELMLILVA